MTARRNEFGQPVGDPMPGWTTRAQPPHGAMIGRYCRVERVSAERHAADLFAAYSTAPDAGLWTYLSAGPFADAAQYETYLRDAETKRDPLHHAIIDSATGKAVGTAALMRIDPANGVVEVGSIAYSPHLQRTRAGTEAIFLFMRRVFDELGYRRFEWKCDSLNAPSRRAAERYGFQYEGTFRQAIVYKGRSRDTAWYSIIDRDWPMLRRAFEQWLAPENFAGDGRQRRSLAECRAVVGKV